MKKRQKGAGSTILLLVWVVWAIAAPLCNARNTPPRSSDNIPLQSKAIGEEEEMQHLLEILDKHTEIATKSKLNADYVPGMVTVLDGEDLLSRGMQTVLEALELVPGIETSINSYGQIDIISRGIGKSGVIGHILKYQVNGIAMNTAHLGDAWMVSAIPLAIVERIEVIAGPGSAVHGEYAYGGVVNVITKKHGNQISGSIGSHNSYIGTGLLSFKKPKHDLSLSLNLASTGTDGAVIDSGEDLAYGLGMPAISNAPGPTNESREMCSGILNIGFKDFSLSAYYLQTGFGDHFGLSNYLPPPDDEIKFQSKNYGAQARQRLHFTPDLETVFSLGYLRYEYSTSEIITAPAGYLGIFPDGLIGNPYYLESRIDGDIEMTWEGFRHQTLKLVYSLAYIQVDDAWHETNFQPSTGAPLAGLTRFSGEENFIDEDVDRWLNSLTLQDEIAVGPDISITAGVRFDHYDDAGTDLSPRMALVWRATDNHIFKTQYAHAFRPPTINQMYTKNNPILSGNKDLESETIDTIELGYIYRTKQLVSRVTLFYSKLNDFIVRDRSDEIYANSDGTTVHSGVEMSFERRLGDSLKLDANFSYVDINDVPVGSATTVANWLGNIGMLYEYNPDLVVNLQGRYVGERLREAHDTREKMNDYFTLDVTGSIFNLWVTGLTMRAGIKNIFNSEIRDPAPTTTDSSGNYVPTYREDYPRPGRQWWVSLSYVF
ncbi:TonB-dependent receptor [Desulfospira joergensenii]|uniref:TonB-dependent receptor n=1 Tax=Desulfospira joergensenii TaxID=53329 RepID=UPI0004097B64|nr:TonB-dependent receptor [Desulfospira joergensenii]